MSYDEAAHELRFSNEDDHADFFGVALNKWDELLTKNPAT